VAVHPSAKAATVEIAAIIIIIIIIISLLFHFNIFMYMKTWKANAANKKTKIIIIVNNKM
jgi:heme/copper-type cytochrome/quinol oxidase subunit 4